jgi:hypothetical protein
MVAHVQRLGVHGMSGDESDHANGRGEATYLILVVPWRDPIVTFFLRVLDALHLRARYQAMYHATPGMWPHFRTPSLKEDTHPAVCRLPRNYYAPRWLKTRNEFQLQELCFNDKIQELTHNEDVLK